MATRKRARAQRKAPRTAPVVQIGGVVDTKAANDMRDALIGQLELATVLGRTEIAIEIARALNGMGNANGLSISHCTFGAV